MNKLKQAARWCGRHLVITCYAVYLAAVLAAGLYGFAADSILRAAGKLQTVELSAADFETVNLAEEGDSWRSQTADPQLLYHADGRVLTVRAELSFDADQGELDLYYTESPGEDFDKYRRVWAVRQADGSYLYKLPRTHIDTLRLDPGSAENLGITIGRIWLNEPVGLAGYFDLSLNGLFRLAVYPALAAAAIQYLLSVWREARRKANGKGSG